MCTSEGFVAVNLNTKATYPLLEISQVTTVMLSIYSFKIYYIIPSLNFQVFLFVSISSAATLIFRYMHWLSHKQSQLLSTRSPDDTPVTTAFLAVHFSIYKAL